MHRSIEKFIFHFLKPYKTWVIAFILCAIISGTWNIFNALLLKLIINTVSTDPDNINIEKTLLWPGLLFLINLQVHDLTWRGTSFISYRIQALFKNDIISYSFEYMCKQPHQYFQNNFSGNITSNISILASNIEKACHEISMHTIRGIVVWMGAMIAMYIVNPFFSVILLVWAVAFCIISLSFSKKIMCLSDKHAESEAHVFGVIGDAIANSQSMRVFANANYERSHLATSLCELKTRFKNKMRFELVLDILQGISVTCLLTSMLYLLVRLRAANLVSVGDFALIIVLSIDVAWCIWFVTERIDLLNDAIGRAKYALNKLFVSYTINDLIDAQKLEVVKGKIVFDKVHFNYPDSYLIFQNKSLIIEPGQKVGLVGLSGGGKTTFVSLILRLYDITSGEILIDGQNIKTITQESLHSAIGVISQDPTLFHRTIMENIRYGRITASDEEVIEAAKSAKVHEFIVSLPQGYESLVGERGVKLSGGQRQRIAIARAILKNASILILDEATSQLDSITELDIQGVLWQLMQNKTTIVVAHRLSTLKHMDRVLVFDKGKVVEDGHHKELLAKNGTFKALWCAQADGYKNETLASMRALIKML